MGATVSGFSLKPDTNPNLYTESKLLDYMSNTFADIKDFEALLTSIQSFNPEIIFHMAAQPLVKQSYLDPIYTYRTNVMGTVHLLEAAKQTPSTKVIVNVTSDKCYENKELLRGYTESDRLGGYDPYSSSKACSELVTTAYQNSFFGSSKIAIASARSGNVIGGGDWAADRLIPDILSSFETEKPLIIRNPNSVRPWQHVLECLSGYLILAENLYEDKETFSGAWNFGPPEKDAKTVKWIIEKMSKFWGKDCVWELDSRENYHETNYLKLDTSKALKCLLWNSKWELTESLQKVISWHRQWKKGSDVKKICEQQIIEFQT
jgi:CDP-glucose 4,6-dehydratase